MTLPSLNFHVSSLERFAQQTNAKLRIKLVPSGFSALKMAGRGDF